MQFKETTPSTLMTFQLGDDPELLHIIKSGFEDQYFCFYENAHETEPWATGLLFLTSEQIKDKWKIVL